MTGSFALTALWLPATCLAFWGARRLYLRGQQRAWLHPVLTASLFLIGLLIVLDVPYTDYRTANMPLIWLLGPATVALAIPTFAQLQRIRAIWPALLFSVLCGSIVAMGSAILLAQALGLEAAVVRSLIPKSVTTPVALGIAEKVGGVPELAAVIVILVGVMGAVFARPWLELLRVTDPAAKGMAIGLSAHGVGTAEAVRMGPVTGAFSGLAMGLTALMTALLAPAALWWLGGA